MGPQQAVAGVGTLKSGVSTDESIHAIMSSSLTQLLQIFYNVIMPLTPYHQFSICSYCDFSIFYLHFSLHFSIDFFHSGAMAKFLPIQFEISQQIFSHVCAGP